MSAVTPDPDTTTPLVPAWDEALDIFQASSLVEARCEICDGPYQRWRGSHERICSPECRQRARAMMRASRRRRAAAGPAPARTAVRWGR